MSDAFGCISIARALTVKIYPVQDGALVDNQYGKLLENLGQLLDRLCDAGDLLIALVDQLENVGARKQ